MLVGQGLPRHVNRLAYIGSFLHCLVPHRYLIVIPSGSTMEDVKKANQRKSKTIKSKSIELSKSTSSASRSTWDVVSEGKSTSFSSKLSGD